MLTILMYHFIRNLPQTQYPRIKARLTSEFRNQLDYMSQHYTFITVDDCLAALAGGPPLPDNAALLTFDDGYLDHYENAFPLLVERRIQGCFFPPVQAITEHRVLDVNKIHFILAAAPALDALLRDVYGLLDELRPVYRFDPNDVLYQRLAVANRFDPAEVIFLKRLLQRDLPPEPRALITDRLFQKYVTTDEPAFAHSLYLSPEHLRTMLAHGMHVGSHGYAHLWLNSIPPDHQRRELAASLDFLTSLGILSTHFTLCYPYGAHNPSLLALARELNFQLGFTTEVTLAHLTPETRLILPRVDTNDLPH